MRRPGSAAVNDPKTKRPSQIQVTSHGWASDADRPCDAWATRSLSDYLAVRVVAMHGSPEALADGGQSDSD